uniref:EF-hand domain-containing protein n=1 Tax=Panagrolaimus superbus TaxID=310955 RepID=A0A914XZN2_9BILA
MKIFSLLLLFLLFINNVEFSKSADKFALRELHVAFQKSDQNKDYYLDQNELNKFVEIFMKRLPSVYKNIRVNNDAVEGGKALAEEMFERKDRNEDTKLDFRGSLISKSEATNFADELEKTLINLVHEIADKPLPYPSINPFAHDGSRRKRSPTTPMPLKFEKYGIPTIEELPNPLVKIDNTEI